MTDNRPSTSISTKPRRPVISHSSVLILSAFLIGLVVHHALPALFEPYLFAAGAAGLVAYLALDIIAARRRERADEIAQRQAEREFVNRMHRHLPRKPRA